MTFKVIGLVIISLIILKYDNRVLGNSGLVEVIDFLATGVLLFAGIWFVLNKTQGGQRIKQKLIDPIIKPIGSETEDWDSATGAPWNNTISTNDRPGIQKSANFHYLIVVVCVIAVVVILSLALTMQSGVSNLYDQSSAMQQMIDGLFSGDGAAAAEGGKRFLSTVWIDIRGILVILGLLIAAIGISYLVFSIVRLKNRNQFTRKEEDDEYWNS